MNFKSYEVEKNIRTLDNKISLFYGQNLGLKNDLKKKIKITFPKATIYNYEQEGIIKNKDNFVNEVFNGSLFNEEKIYFLENTTDKILSLVQELEEKIEKQRIYLFAEILDKKSKIRNYFEKSKKLAIIPCYEDTEINLKTIISEKLKGFEGLSYDALKTILDNSNLDRIRLNNEITKIQSFFINKKINTIELSKLLNPNENDNFNLLKDAAISGETKKTSKLLSETLLEEDKIMFYLAVINQRIQKINEILSIKNLPIEETINSMKPPIFWKDKPRIIAQTKKWNYRKIKNALARTFELEVRTKTSSLINKKILLKKLFIDICELANA